MKPSLALCRALEDIGVPPEWHSAEQLALLAEESTGGSIKDYSADELACMVLSLNRQGLLVDAYRMIGLATGNEHRFLAER